VPDAWLPPARRKVANAVLIFSFPQRSFSRRLGLMLLSGILGSPDGLAEARYHTVVRESYSAVGSPVRRSSFRRVGDDNLAMKLAFVPPDDEEKVPEIRAMSADASSSSPLAPHRVLMLRAKNWLDSSAFTLEYWRPLAYSLGIIVVITEIVGPALDLLVVSNLGSECCLFTLTSFAFAAVVFSTSDDTALGDKELVATAATFCFVSILMLVISVLILCRVREERSPVKTIATDVSKLFRPLARCIVLFVLVDVVVKEICVAWGNFLMLAAVIVLGATLAITGMVGDIVGHVLIRIDQHFYEDDFLYLDGDLTQVKRLEWRHAVGLRWRQKALVYIPNRELAGKIIVNRSRDNAKVVEFTLPLNQGLKVEAMQEIVKEVWGMIKTSGQDSFTFPALDENTYSSQVDPDNCLVYLQTCSPDPHGDKDQPARFDLHLKLAGRHSGEKAAWSFHVEWLLLEVKDAIDAHQ